MKITTTYTCEICGFSSENKEEVQKCEAQGAKSKFSVDEEVEYKYRYHPSPLENDEIIEQWVRVKIVSVRFSEKTHEVCYGIGRIIWPPKEKLPQWGARWSDRPAGEDELRPVSVATA